MTAQPVDHAGGPPAGTLTLDRMLAVPAAHIKGMTTFADHQHPRATDGKFTAVPRAEATVSLEGPPSLLVTAADVVTCAGDNRYAGRLMVEQTRQAIHQSGPQPFPEGPYAEYILGQYFPEGTKIVDGAGEDEERTLLMVIDSDGETMWTPEGGESGEVISHRDFWTPTNIVHIP